MGLVKNDYQFKGYILHQAYARVQVNTERKEATFYIGEDRETAFTQPIEKVKLGGVPFTHKENPFTEAYAFAKGQYKEVQFDEESGEIKVVELNRPFFGWEDDIIEK